MNIEELIKLGNATVSVTTNPDGKVALGIFSDGKPAFSKVFSASDVAVIDNEATAHCWLNSDQAASELQNQAKSTVPQAEQATNSADDLLNEFRA